VSGFRQAAEKPVEAALCRQLAYERIGSVAIPQGEIAATPSRGGFFSDLLGGRCGLEYIIAGVVAIGLFIYLVFALLRPERF
jgi:K+-transporting ATPase KdpF subunit